MIVTFAFFNHPAKHNTFRYRGYYYDIESGFYYLSRRYYDSQIGRFINADGYVSTGQGVLGNNMFVYCGNNPVNHTDSTGMFWEEICGFFSNTWNDIITWSNNTFGAGFSVTETEKDYEDQLDLLLISVKTGGKSTQIVSEYGDSSKPISVYANIEKQQPIKSSSAGIRVSISGFTLDYKVGLDDMGLSCSFINGNTTNSFGVNMNLSELKKGFEVSSTVQWDDNKTKTTYSNASINGWTLIAAYILVTTGQYVPSPSYAH